MKIKNIIYLMIGLTFFACEDEEISLQFQDIAWVAGDADDQQMLQVAKNDILTFTDLSINASSHQWKINEGSFFLNAARPAGDTAFTKFITQGRTSSAATVNVLFTEAGIDSVTLRNTFSDSVAWISSANDTLPAKKNDNGTWAIDTAFRVDVFDDVKVAYKVYLGDTATGTEILSFSTTDTVPAIQDWKQQELERGQFLTFVDMSGGRANLRTWSIINGITSVVTGTTETLRVFYPEISPVDQPFPVGSLAARRSETLPRGNDRKLIPLLVSVVQCTTPGDFAGNLKVSELDVISFSASVPLLSINSDSEKDNFKIKVKNGSKDFEAEYSPATVSLVGGTTIELTLPEGQEIYFNDTVMVSYAGGNIPTDCGTSLNAFTFQTAEIEGEFEVNLVADPIWNNSFEDGGDLPSNYFVQHAEWTRAEAPAAGHGEFSLRQMFDGKQAAATSRIQHNHEMASGSIVEGQQMSIGAWMYVNSAGTDKSLLELSNNFKYELRTTGPGASAFLQFNLSDHISEALGNLDQWVWVERVYTVNSTQATGNPIWTQVRLEFRGQNNTGKVDLYVDDLSVQKVDRRP